MRCTQCQAEIPNDSVFCPSCGQKVTKPAPPDPVADKKCRQCQALLDPEAKFCEACGTPVENARTSCPSCRAPVASGAAFCNNCGHRMAGSKTASQETWQAPPPAPYQPAQPQSAWSGQAAAPQPAQAYPPYAQGAYAAYPAAGPARPPKKKKGWLVAVIIVVILAIAGTATALLAGKQIRRMLMGPKATYLAIEAQALQQQADDLVANLAKLSDATAREPKGGVDLQLRLDLDADTLGIDPVLDAILDNLSVQSTFIYDHSGPAKRSFTAIDLFTQDERLLTLEAFIDPDRMVIGLPGILNQYVMASYSELGSLMDMDIGVDVDDSLGVLMQVLEMDLDVDHDALQKTLYKAIDIMLEHIDSVEFEKNQPLRAGSVTANYDLYTVTMTSENIRLMLLEILQLVRDDQEVYNLVNSVITLAASVDPYAYETAMTYREYQTAIDDALSELEDADEETFTLIQKIYVDKDDQVAGRDIEVLDEFGDSTGRLLLLHPVQGDQEAWLVSFADEYQEMRLLAQYTVKDGRKTGTASVVVDQETVLDVTFSNVEIKEIGSDDYPLGEITFRFDAGSDMPDTVHFKGWEEGGRFWISIGLPDYGALEIGYRRLSGTDVRIPSIDESNVVSLDDPYALDTLFDEDVMMKLMEIMEKLGLSDYMYDMYE